MLYHLLKMKYIKKYLYGSYARGDYTSESDIDIMIVLRCDKDKVKSNKKTRQQSGKQDWFRE